MTYLPYVILKAYKNDPTNKNLTFEHNGEKFMLEPVVKNDNVVKVLAEWRNKFYDAFPSRFKVTIDGTGNWLQKQVIDNEDRFLFLIKKNGDILGHLGFFRFSKEENSCEVDNVVKGTEGYPGLMTMALNRMIDFAFKELQLSSLSLRVFADNERAIRLYEKCGFKGQKKIPLSRKGTDELYSWEECEDDSKAQRFFLQMILFH